MLLPTMSKNESFIVVKVADLQINRLPIWKTWDRKISEKKLLRYNEMTRQVYEREQNKMWGDY